MLSKGLASHFSSFSSSSVHRLFISGPGGTGPSHHDEVARSFHGERSNNSRSDRRRSGRITRATDAGKLAKAQSPDVVRAAPDDSWSRQVGDNRSNIRARLRTTRSESGPNIVPMSNSASIPHATTEIPAELGPFSRIGSQFFSHANCIAVRPCHQRCRLRTDRPSFVNCITRRPSVRRDRFLCGSTTSA